MSNSKNPQYTKDEVQKRAYEAYQLDWMRRAGYSINDILNVLREYYVSAAMDGELELDMNTACDSAEEYFQEQGFNGEMFVCFAEFLGAEYLDTAYISSILPDDYFQSYCIYQHLDTRG